LRLVDGAFNVNYSHRLPASEQVSVGQGALGADYTGRCPLGLCGTVALGCGFTSF